jgi:hypothetical protein
MASFKYKPLGKTPSKSIILLKLFKSLSMLLEIPVYYILIATLSPFFNIAS